MAKFAVLGSPIDHSLSPTIHRKAMEILGITGEYERFNVSEDSFVEFLESHKGDWSGFSLTMPLKEIACSVGKASDEAALLTQVGNTLIASPDGWLAFNTDATGFSLLTDGFDFERVAILGSGGTARAALFAIRNQAKEIEVYRRSAKNDEALRRISQDATFCNWSNLSKAFQSQLVINATSVSASEDIARVAEQVPYAIDAIYSPWPPPLFASQKGANYKSGKDLLVAQALGQIELFHNVSFDKRELFDALRASI
jgi:shikimate dehydrogenase